jgi:hypothetical protein
MTENPHVIELNVKIALDADEVACLIAGLRDPAQGIKNLFGDAGQNVLQRLASDYVNGALENRVESDMESHDIEAFVPSAIALIALNARGKLGELSDGNLSGLVA